MGRRNNDDGMAIPVEKEAFAKLAKQHPQFTSYARHWSYNRENDAVKIPTRAFNLASMKTLLAIQDKLPATEDIVTTETRKETALMLGSFIKVFENPSGAKVAKLRPLEQAIIEFLKIGIQRAWIFDRDESGYLQAKLVTDVKYHPLQISERSRTPAHVTLYLRHWEKGRDQNSNHTWHVEDLRGGKTVQELFTAAGLFKEDAELLAKYDADEKQFLEWRKMLGEQFVGQGEFEAQGEDRWSREAHDMLGSRMIIDDKCATIEMTEGTLIFDDGDGEHSQGSPEAIAAADRFTRMPLAFYIYCFNLSTYDGGFAHMSSLRPYVYRPELRDKLVLPPEHGDLIDALTADMNVLMEDIISGKSGGTTILCQGKAGTGKTLTAEVYAEAIKRPLYRVHSGQLGTDAESVEEALKKALTNAKRWRAVLLIDEADVFVSARGDNLEKNAVIGVFLRVLEYYDGLLFLTTNRVDDIDEAILSRCIAVIKYSIPDVPERERIWLTLGEVYGMKVVSDKGMARKLAEAFTCSGRDIKGLIKLVTKYARQRDKKPTMEDFKRMAAFRGL